MTTTQELETIEKDKKEMIPRQFEKYRNLIHDNKNKFYSEFNKIFPKMAARKLTNLVSNHYDFEYLKNMKN